MEAESLNVPFNSKFIKVVSLNWNHKSPTSITVQCAETKREATVKFSRDSGVRILHELDISSFWLGDNLALKESWLLKVNSGGWYEFESTRDDFCSKFDQTRPNEYLIIGYQECVSILSEDEPVIVNEI